MKFSEAMEKLKSGVKVTRATWKGRMYFLIVKGEVKTFQSHISPYSYNEDIMVSDGWILEGVDQEMNFTEIIPYLQKGMRAKLKSWDEIFIYLDNSIQGLASESMVPFQFTPDFASFMAEDWIELE